MTQCLLCGGHGRWHVRTGEVCPFTRANRCLCRIPDTMHDTCLWCGGEGRVSIANAPWLSTTPPGTGL